MEKQTFILKKRVVFMRGNERFFRLGLTVFCTVASVLLFYDTLFGSHALQDLWSKFVNAVSPILLGAFLAYLLAPMVNYFERLFFYVFVRRAKRKGKLSAPVVRAISVLLVWTVVLVALILILSILLPELYRSAEQFAANTNNYYDTISGWIQTLFERFPDVETWLTDRLEDAYKEIDTFVRSSLSQIQSLMAAAGRGFLGVMNFLKDLIVGVIVSVYLMGAKEHSAASAKRTLYSFFSPQGVRWITKAVKRADSIFSGFVRGKLLDSLIIGILCFLGCLIFNFPYSPLVSVFVGVTNVIPFFGPFIGAVPSTFLILLVSPMQALYFIAFILALQQLDGNVIGPKILGDQTGLSSFGVIVAILVGGSFFGIPGMFFGVPVFACICSAWEFLIQLRLENRGLPLEVKAYEQDPKAPKLPVRDRGGKKALSGEWREEEEEGQAEKREGTARQDASEPPAPPRERKWKKNRTLRENGEVEEVDGEEGAPALKSKKLKVNFPEE